MAEDMLTQPSGCQGMRRRAALAPDGMISAFEEQMLRIHCRICLECASFASDVEAITAMLRSEPLASVPASGPAHG